MENRITYLDSAKGICMLLIVMSHVGLPEPWPYCYAIRVPLFFILSGFFLHTQLPLREQLTKKARTLIIPFVLFWIISYALFYMLEMFLPQFQTTHAKGILDCFTQHEYFNGPLWFLPALFWAQMVIFLLYKLVRLECAILAATLFLGFVGYYLGTYDCFLPLGMDIAMTSVPFLYFGLKINDVKLFENQKWYWLIVCAILLYIVGYYENIDLNMSLNQYDCEYLQLVFGVLVLSLSLIYVCILIASYVKVVDRSLSLIGRNSMWIMCSHHLIYRPVKALTNHYCSDPYGPWIVLLVTIVICLLSAPLVERYAPILIGKRRK